MKQFISDSLNIYARVTAETLTHFVCGEVIYPKTDIVVDYHPMDNMEGVLHLHIVPFYN